MSRSNPNEGARNPSTRWFEWAGGSDGGYIRWYDKDTKAHVKAEPFTFLLLDELSTIKGWHDPSESAIYANAVRNLREDVLVVKSFNGGELVRGLYSSIKDAVGAKGGHYCVSLYLGYKVGDELLIGCLNLKGAAAGAWMEFKKTAGSKKDASGKSVRAYYLDAVKVAGFTDAKKGATAYRIPKFALVPVGEDTNKQALALDAELQAYLAEYLKKPEAEAAKPMEPEHEAPPKSAAEALAEMESDIPF